MASLNDRGQVAFQAALREGGSGVFLGDGHQLRTLVRSPDIYSHPDLDQEGQVAYYARDPSGREGVYLDGRCLADSGGELAGIGPLGPVLEGGQVAFRADLQTGESGVFLATPQGLRCLAHTKGPYLGFQGLPLVNSQGLAVFRADLPGDRQALFSWRDGEVTRLVEGSAMGRFPSLNDEGVVAFSQGSGLYLYREGRVEPAPTEGAFESLRGVLLNNRGTLVFTGTPVGGSLGIYGQGRRLLGLGDSVEGRLVTELALNPVSLNHQDQLAVRLRLDDGSQRIVRLELALRPAPSQVCQTLTNL